MSHRTSPSRGGVGGIREDRGDRRSAEILSRAYPPLEHSPPVRRASSLPLTPPHTSPRIPEGVRKEYRQHDDRESRREQSPDSFDGEVDFGQITIPQGMRTIRTPVVTIRTPVVTYRNSSQTVSQAPIFSMSDYLSQPRGIGRGRAWCLGPVRSPNPGWLARMSEPVATSQIRSAGRAESFEQGLRDYQGQQFSTPFTGTGQPINTYVSCPGRGYGELRELEGMARESIQSIGYQQSPTANRVTEGGGVP